MTPDLAGLVSAEDAAAALGLSTHSLRIYVRQGKLAGRLVSGRWLISRASVEAYKANRRPAHRPAAVPVYPPEELIV